MFNGSVLNTSVSEALVKAQEDGDAAATATVARLRAYMEENFLKVNIYFESNTLEKIEETPK